MPSVLDEVSDTVSRSLEAIEAAYGVRVFEPPEVVSEGIVATIEGDTFEHYLPDLKSIAEFKTADIDTFLQGSADQLR